MRDGKRYFRHIQDWISEVFSHGNDFFKSQLSDGGHNGQVIDIIDFIGGFDLGMDKTFFFHGKTGR